MGLDYSVAVAPDLSFQFREEPLGSGELGFFTDNFSTFEFNTGTVTFIGTEFVGMSISSSFGDGAETNAVVALAVPGNPHTKFFDGLNRGYVRCTVTPNTWQTDYRTVDTIESPTSGVQTLASFVVENGRPGAQPA